MHYRMQLGSDERETLVREHEQTIHTWPAQECDVCGAMLCCETEWVLHCADRAMED